MVKDSIDMSCSGNSRDITSFIEIRETENEGKEKIKGTDVPVWKIVKLHLEGTGIDGIMERYAELSEEEIRGAISYYYCNRRRIERQLSESEKDDLKE